MVVDHKTIIFMIPKLYAMKIATTLNTTNRFKTQTISKKSIEQQQYQQHNKITLHYRHSKPIDIANQSGKTSLRSMTTTKTHQHILPVD